MTKEIIVTDHLLMSRIIELRGQKVMLDSDLAELYGVETKQLKRQVRRNVERFPIEFMFELTNAEYENLRSQNGTTNRGGSRYLPFAFTEHGVLMLSSVLNSESAIQVNITIIKIFTKLRESLLSNKDILLKLAQIDKKLIHLVHDVKMHDGEIETIFELINDIREEKKKLPLLKTPIGFKTKSTKK